MKFKRIYMEGGLEGKADNTDYVIGYLAENGKIINIEELINTNYRFYVVDGISYQTLEEAKRAVRLTTAEK